MINCNLFKDITETDLEKILNCFSAHKKSFDKDEYIFHSGNSINEIGIIIKGGVNIIKEDFWGNRAIISKIIENDIFGETFSLSSENKINVSVVAFEHTEVLFLNCNKIILNCDNNCKFHRQIIKNILKIICEKNIMLTKKIEHIMKKTTKEKILSFLSEEAIRNKNNKFSIKFNRQELADYLSVDRSALSNELSKLKKEGIIEFNKNKFIINKEVL